MVKGVLRSHVTILYHNYFVVLFFFFGQMQLQNDEEVSIKKFYLHLYNACDSVLFSRLLSGKLGNAQHEYLSLLC